MDGRLAKSSYSDDLQELWQTYFAERSDQVRNELVDRYMALANKIAAYYYGKRIGGQTDFHDYQNLAVIGLIQAIEKFEDNSSAKFETYASYRIKGSILNAIRKFSEKNAFLTQEQIRKRDLIESITLNAPDGEEMGLFEKIIEVTLNLSYSSLLDSALQYDVEQHASTRQLDGYHHCELHDLKRIITDIVASLPKKQQVIVQYYYYYELSFVDISAVIGVSKGRVSHLHKQAIESIRETYNRVVNLSQI